MARFKHDCPACISLGEFDGRDLYYCETAILPTVIARYGDNGPDYSSGMALAKFDLYLGEAKRRAKDRGLIEATP